MLGDHAKSRLNYILQSLIEANDIVLEETARSVDICVCPSDSISEGLDCDAVAVL